MTTFRDYYTILEVQPGATADEIKRAYRRLAFQYHPDTNRGNKHYEEKFKEINAAFEVLSDEQKRKTFNAEYNAHFHTEERQTQKRPKIKLTASEIANRAITLHAEADGASKARSINRNALFVQMTNLLSRENIETIRQTADRGLTRKIIDELMGCNNHLWSLADQEIYNILLHVAGDDRRLRRRIKIHRKTNYLPKIIKRYPIPFAAAGLILVFAIGLAADAIVKEREQEQNRLHNEQNYTTPLHPNDTLSRDQSVGETPLVKDTSSTNGNKAE